MTSSRRWRILPVIFYVLLIFFVSSRPDLKPPGPEFASRDKVAHFIEYSILGVLLFKGIGWSASRIRLITFTFLFAVGVSIGALDEILQSYTAGRTMSILDWLADALGVAIGVGIFAFTSLGKRKAERSSKD